jgi:hypothetical protein
MTRCIYQQQVQDSAEIVVRKVGGVFTRDSQIRLAEDIVSKLLS